MAHHPKCFQSTRTPEQLVADGLAPDQCDCRMLRMIDAAQCPNGCGPGFACSDCPSPPPTREQLIALVDSLLAENERLDADNASLVANNEGLAADRERVELGADAVPVGVQPEPAEERCGVWAESGPCILPAGHNRGRADVPTNHAAAVPVVHPEPGDRATRWYAAFAPGDRLHPATVVDRLMALADAEVAAAVAAVRADRDRLAGQVAAIRALCDEAEAWARPTGSGAPHVSIDRIRAALVASSPTTRPTHPESTSPSRTALDPEAPK